MSKNTKSIRQSNAVDMTTGTIWKQIVLFSLPLLFGNIFQQLYNTVDSLVVGNFVGADAVGASKRPLYFLIVASMLNIFLDLLFVIKFKMGVAGVAYATVISQFISGILGMIVLMKSRENYGISLREIKMDPKILKMITIVGLPAGLQMAITSFSNVFVQGYINSFGAASTAGWGTYGRVDAFVLLPMQSIAIAAM